jgi:hypothetical protein
MFRLESFPSGEVVTHVGVETADAIRAWAQPGIGTRPASEIRLWVGPEESVHIRGSGAMHGAQGTVSWWGRPEDDPTGLVVLTPTAHGFVGIVQANHRRWEIRHLGDGVEQVVEHLGFSSAGTGCSAAEAETPTSEAPESEPQALAAGHGVELPVGPICNHDPAADQLDLLVIMTLGGRDEAGATDPQELWAILQNRVDWGNAALRGSGVIGTVRLVDLIVLDLGMVSPTTMNDGLTVPQILECLKNPTNPECSPTTVFVDAFRDAAGADLVAVITDFIKSGEPQDPACPTPPLDGADTDTLPDDDSDADTVPEPGCDNDDNDGEPDVGGLACTECVYAGTALPFFEAPVLNHGLACWSGPGASNPWVVAQFESGWNTLIHEIGHKLGAGHGLWQNNTPNNFEDNTAWLAPDCTFHTIMGAGPFDGTPCVAKDVDDIPYFSNACVRAAQPNSSGLPQATGDDDRENARIMAEAFPYVSAYRAEMLPPPVLAQITSPPDGVTVDATFLVGGDLPITMNLASANRFIEVGTTPGANDIFGQLLPPGTAGVTILGWSQPTTASFSIRLWTEVLGGFFSHWEYVDFRYNYAGSVQGCNFSNTVDAIALAGSVPSDFANRDCTTDGPTGPRLICSYTGASTLTCDLGTLPHTTGAVIEPFWAEASTRRQATEVFDYVVWGSAQKVAGGVLLEDAEPFCCGFRESSTSKIHEFALNGTPQDNSLRLHQCSFQDLYPVTGPLSTTLQGRDGEDIIIGSDFTGSSYSETLQGGFHNDRIYGFGGDDDIFGNEGNDNLFGGDGDDFIQGNAGDDQLIGGEGTDTLWGGDDDDTLQGNTGSDDLRGGAGADLLCDAVEADDLRGQGGADRMMYIAPPLPTMAGPPDRPGPGVDTCSLTTGLVAIWPTCEINVPINDPNFDECPEWNP